MAQGAAQEGAARASRRIFSAQFKLQVLDSYRRDPDCRGNQRATARKYGIHRRQIQKWLQMEGALRARRGSDSEEEAIDFSLRGLDLTTKGHKRLLLDLDSARVEPRSPPQELRSQEQNLRACTASPQDLGPPPSPQELLRASPDGPQEAALCLVKQPSPPPDTILYRPYSLCCTPAPPPPDPYEHPHWTKPYYFHASYVTKWLQDDVHYYKQAVKEISLYSTAPLHT